MKNIVLVLIAAGLFTACSSPEKNVNSIVEDFASLNCRAVELRKKRFDLADSIRFSEDTLLNNKSDSILQKRMMLKLQRYEQEKSILVKNSLLLADTIRVRLDSLMKNELADHEKRKLFDAALEKELIKQGCK